MWVAAPSTSPIKSVTLPPERDDHPGVVAVHLFGDIDDDRTVSLGKIGIGQLHDRDNPAIDGEAEHCLGETLHVAHDLLGRLVQPRQDMDLGDGCRLRSLPGQLRRPGGGGPSLRTRRRFTI